MISDIFWPVVDTFHHCLMLQYMMQYIAAAFVSVFKIAPVSDLFVITENNVK
jgi:hypothetical protein